MQRDKSLNSTSLCKYTSPPDEIAAVVAPAATIWRRLMVFDGREEAHTDGRGDGWNPMKRPPDGWMDGWIDGWREGV